MNMIMPAESSSGKEKEEQWKRTTLKD